MSRRFFPPRPNERLFSAVTAAAFPAGLYQGFYQAQSIPRTTDFDLGG